MHAMLLAGGKGTRMRPLTAAMPKALLPVEGVPVIVRLIKQLQQQGIDQLTVVTGHLAAQVEQHLGTGRRLGVRIDYLREVTPLGTAGCLGQWDAPHEPFLVVNADVVTDLDFSNLLECHRRSGTLATVATARHRVSIDLGVVECDSMGRMIEYREKPDVDYWVSMGIYCLDPAACRFVTRGECVSMPEVLRRLREAGEMVHCHHADCNWRDIGRPEEYALANAGILAFPQRGAARRAA